jgi:hypothetical protein
MVHDIIAHLYEGGEYARILPVAIFLRGLLRQVRERMRKLMEFQGVKTGYFTATAAGWLCISDYPTLHFPPEIVLRALASRLLISRNPRDPPLPSGTIWGKLELDMQEV